MDGGWQPPMPDVARGLMTPDGRQLSQMPPLWLSAKNGWEDIVVHHLEIYCSNENRRMVMRDDDAERRTPLWWAARNGHAKIVEILLGWNSDINRKDNKWITPLHAAVLYGHCKVVNLLLARQKVDANCKELQTSNSPLHLAVWRGDDDVVKLLLDHDGVDINPRNNDDRTPLHIAANKGLTHITGLLLSKDGIQVHPRCNNGQTPLLEAAREGHKEVVVALLAAAESVNKDSLGQALLAAAGGGHKEVVEVLLAHPADVNFRDSSWQTALHKAAEGGHSEVVGLLLADTQISMHVRNDKGATPLLLAAERNRKEVVELFFAKDGVRPKPKGSYNQVLLRYAVQKGESGVAHLLLEEDGDLNTIHADDEKHTLLWLAAQRNDERMMQVLLKRDSGTLHALAKSGDLPLMQQLLAAGYDLSARDALGRSALHVATLFGHLQIASGLISADVNVDSEDNDGNTPLRLAILQKRHDFTELFLSSSASTAGTPASEWLESYARDASDVVCLEERQHGDKTIRFINEKAALQELRNAATQSHAVRRMFMLSNSVLCQEGQVPQLTKPSQPDILHTSESKLSASEDITFSVGVWFPAGQDRRTGEHFKVPDWGHCRITWTVALPQWATNHNSGRISMDHFSMLSNGWIPQDGVEFFAQFLDNLKERWLKVCNLAEQHLTDCRLKQLQERGQSRELITQLAQNAQTWTNLRRTLAGHVSAAEEFAVGYCARHNGNQGRDKIKRHIDGLATDVGVRIDQLDQIVRDLLQLEFAWVSITEAHRSISLATSMKRLSWVTFIFLPAMFASSLFGMNVNILKDNPDWRWFLLAGGVCLTSTMCAWLIFKYCPIELWLERNIGRRIKSVTNTTQVGMGQRNLALGRACRDRGSLVQASRKVECLGMAHELFATLQTSTSSVKMIGEHPLDTLSIRRDLI